MKALGKKTGYVFFLSMVLLTVFSAVRVSAAPPEKLSSQALCEYAVERYQKGDMKDAIHEFNKLLLIDPGNETARNYLRSPSIDREMKYLEREIARKEEKLKELRKLINDGCSSGTSMSAESLCEYAQERYRQGFQEDAKHEFRKLLMIDPENQVAKSYLNQPSMSKQIEYLEAYIERLQARLEKLKGIIKSCDQR